MLQFIDTGNVLCRRIAHSNRVLEWIHGGLRFFNISERRLAEANALFEQRIPAIDNNVDIFIYRRAEYRAVLDSIEGQEAGAPPCEPPSERRASNNEIHREAPPSNIQSARL